MAAGLAALISVRRRLALTHLPGLGRVPFKPELWGFFRGSEAIARFQQIHDRAQKSLGIGFQMLQAEAAKRCMPCVQGSRATILAIKASCSSGCSPVASMPCSKPILLQVRVGLGRPMKKNAGLTYRLEDALELSVDRHGLPIVSALSIHEPNKDSPNLLPGIQLPGKNPAFYPEQREGCSHAAFPHQLCCRMMRFRKVAHAGGHHQLG